MFTENAVKIANKNKRLILKHLIKKEEIFFLNFQYFESTLLDQIYLIAEQTQILLNDDS